MTPSDDTTADADEWPPAIVDELGAYRAWVCWRYEERTGTKPTKVPHNPRGDKASHSDARTWSSLDEARAATGFVGIGFVFSTGDPFFGIDLDRAIDEQGMLKPWAEPIVQTFIGRAYVEFSPSATGLHIIGRGKVPQGRKQEFEHGGIEVYSSERFFTITGRPYVGPVTP